MVATSIASPPPSSGGLAPHLLSTNSIDQQPPWKSQAVNRTNELLSCARTALKIGQQQYRQRLQQQQQQLQQQQGQQGLLLFQSKSSTHKNDDFPEWLVDINPAQLTLYQPPPPSFTHHHHDNNHDTTNTNNSDSTTSLLSDSQSLLSLLDSNLSQLHSLVRKRGHTNDPTQQINSLMSKFQEAAQELKQVCELVRLAGSTMPVIVDSHDGLNRRTKSSGQRRKHYELVSTQLELLAKERMEKFKGELETRSQVLRDQTNRRKLLATGAGAGSAGGKAVIANGTSNGPTRTTAPTTRLSQPSRLPPNNSNPKNASSQFQSPLFTATSGGGGSNGVQRRGNASKNTSAAASAAGYSGYAGYGGTTNNNTASSSSSSAGYGGTTTRTGYGGIASTTPSSSSAPSFATGIRQRKQQQQQSRIQIDHGNDDDKYNKDTSSSSTATVQQQIQERRQNRAAQSRLASARLAEKSIAELGVMFTKMSTLISQQGEVLERIEDDVEAAGMDIDAGHDELVKVYGMTKGNRGLILKVFGILIFLIVFMKLY